MTDAHMFADWPAVTLAEHEAAYHPGRPCPEDEQGRCAARFPRPVPSPEDRMHHARTDTPHTTDPAPTHPGRSFRTWMSDTDRDQLDARAATAEQERDDALDDRDNARAEAANLRRELDKANVGRQKLQEQLDTKTAVAQSNKRHVACLTALLERIHALTISTDGDDIHPDAEIPIGEIRRVLNEPLPPSSVPPRRAQEDRPHAGLHVTRGSGPSDLEANCPCPKEPCGAVDTRLAEWDCEHHPAGRAKTMRHMHRADQCPGAPR